MQVIELCFSINGIRVMNDTNTGQPIFIVSHLQIKIGCPQTEAAHHKQPND